MSNHIYPQTDEVDKLRLDKIIQKAKDLNTSTKKEMFAKLESSLASVFGEGNINFSDLSKLLSEGFTDFEQYLVTLPDQDAAEVEESKYWLTDRLHSEGVLTKPFN